MSCLATDSTGALGHARPGLAYAGLVAGLIAGLAGCPAPERRPVATPEELAAAGDWEGAAARYLQIAQTAPAEEAMEYRLEAGALLVRAGDVQRAQEVLSGVRAGPGTPAAVRRDLLLAGIALQAGRTEGAFALLDYAPASVPTALREEYHALRADTYALAGNPIEEGRELAALLSLRPASEEGTRLWRLLGGLDLERLRHLRTRPGDDFSGWVELAIIDKTMLHSREDWDTAVEFWREQYPGHASLERLLPNLRQRNLRFFPQPGQVALFLPLTGPYAQAGRAVRDGVLAGWYRHDALYRVQRPMLRLYDSHGDEPAELLERAVADGAEFVIGPLLKEAVTDLLSLTSNPPVPILALNESGNALGQIPALGEPEALPFLQFGLVPEDEARQAAERARLDGHTTALAMIPEGAWGERLLQAFRDVWQTSGGLLLGYATYRQGQDADYAGPLERLLNVTGSRRRIARLEQILQRPMSASPRARQDVGFIFFAATSESARQLVPQLRLLGVGDIPVYATSQVNEDLAADTEAGRDLEGIRFPEMPWILDPEFAGPEWREVFEVYQRYEGKGDDRLFALGLDAYNLMFRFGTLTLEPSSYHRGLTGNLYLDREGRIRRSLTWAQFETGRPKRLDPVD